MRTTLFPTTLLFIFYSLTFTNIITNTFLNAAEQKQITLWEQGAPNALGTEDKDKPRITVWLPDKNNAVDMAVVVCPGGGYGGLALDHEGKQIAEWFNSFGVTAAILEYRHRGKGYGHPNPMLDVQRAIRTVRFNAKDWGIDPSKIGVMGFSAGGHLASTAGTHFDNVKEPNDEIDKISCRPDFMILCYPVILFDTKFTHRGSQNNLIGANAPKELVDYYSNEKQVTEKTPPTFIFFTNEDAAVPVENGVEFYLALRKYKIPAELHIYQKGGHGQGLAKKQRG
ncbi:MAG: alpha/beta hydrolase, partial [Planctomycetaceae bacterium]|nr:alpha/beta hydrolase [Planctomycetaceae bacterium]